MQTLAGEEADAAEHWRVPIDEWYKKPRWARAGMVAQLRKRGCMARWDKILNPPKKGNK